MHKVSETEVEIKKRNAILSANEWRTVEKTKYNIISEQNGHVMIILGQRRLLFLKEIFGFAV